MNLAQLSVKLEQTTEVTSKEFSFETIMEINEKDWQNVS